MMTENKTLKEAFKEAENISQKGDTQGALELLLDFFFEMRSKMTIKEEIELIEKEHLYLMKLREETLSLIEIAKRFFEEGKLGSAEIKAQQALEIFEKFGTKTSVSLTRDLIDKIKRKQEEEMTSKKKKQINEVKENDGK